MGLKHPLPPNIGSTKHVFRVPDAKPEVMRVGLRTPGPYSATRALSPYRVEATLPEIDLGAAERDIERVAAPLRRRAAGIGLESTAVEERNRNVFQGGLRRAMAAEGAYNPSAARSLERGLSESPMYRLEEQRIAERSEREASAGELVNFGSEVQDAFTQMQGAMQEYQAFVDAYNDQLDRQMAQYAGMDMTEEEMANAARTELDRQGVTMQLADAKRRARELRERYERNLGIFKTAVAILGAGARVATMGG